MSLGRRPIQISEWPVQAVAGLPHWATQVARLLTKPLQQRRPSWWSQARLPVLISWRFVRLQNTANSTKYQARGKPSIWRPTNGDGCGCGALQNLSTRQFRSRSRFTNRNISFHWSARRVGSRSVRPENGRGGIATCRVHLIPANLKYPSSKLY